MKNSLKYFVLLLAFATVLSCSQVLASASVDREISRSAAPAFSLSTVNGKTVSLSDLRGKDVMIFFFTTWCPWCRKKIPELIKNEAQYKSEGIELLLVDVGESQAKVFSFANKQRIPLDILLDKDMKVSGDYNVVGVPMIIMISKDGQVVYAGNDTPPNYKKIYSQAIQ